MKYKIINFVKYNKIIYQIYYLVASFFINILRLLVKTDNKIILFTSFAGRKYDDSPRILFEAMKRDERFNEYKFVWAFHNPSKYKIAGAQIIKTDCLKYFITALKARVWITNSSIERGLDFKGKNTFYLNTWHGTPLKKMGSDISNINESFGKKIKHKWDIMNVQSDFEASVFSRAFEIPRNRYIKVGLPRNDILSNYTDGYKKQIKEKLGILDGKKIILYLPTFREYDRDITSSCVLAPPIDLKKWKRHYQWIILCFLELIMK